MKNKWQSDKTLDRCILYSWEYNLEMNIEIKWIIVKQLLFYLYLINNITEKAFPERKLYPCRGYRCFFLSWPSRLYHFTLRKFYHFCSDPQLAILNVFSQNFGIHSGIQTIFTLPPPLEFFIDSCVTDFFYLEKPF